MLRRIVPAILLLALLLAAMAAVATATPNRDRRVDRQIRTLQRQVDALRGELRTLRHTQTNTIPADCVAVIPIARYGDPAGTYGPAQGYAYTWNTQPLTSSLVGGLDAISTTTGLVPGSDYQWVATIDNACISPARHAPIRTATFSRTTR